MIKNRTIPNFNMEKLPEYVETELTGKKVAVIGGGAVGSHAAAILAQQGVVDITIIDMDTFETTNIAKGSFVYDPIEDDGKNKAVALANRINYRLGADFVHGIDSNIANFGPMAFADYDVLILALDNYGAKVIVNHIWKQIPEDKRPLLIYGGTEKASAQSNCLDGSTVCIRCLFDESWLEKPMERTSCNGINYREESISAESSRTTGGASLIAAALMAEDCVAYLLGYDEMRNTQSFYSSYPNQKLNKFRPMGRSKRKPCPDCMNYHSVEDGRCLANMDVLHTTVGELLDELTKVMTDENFEVLAPVIEPGKIIYNRIIKDDYCRCCGKELKHIYKHEFKTKYSDLVCDECRESKARLNSDFKELEATTIGAITLKNCDENLRAKTLYEVGFPLGAFIRVKQEKGIFPDVTVNYYNFYCENDSAQMDVIDKLEG